MKYYYYICYEHKNKTKMVFTNYGLSINVSRSNDNEIKIEMSSDFSGSVRKSRLFVNTKSLNSFVESVWKSVKTTKKLKMYLGFFEIDWYDDSCGSFDIPSISIRKGLSKSKTQVYNSNTIPKEWGVCVTFTINDTKTKTPVIEIIQKTLNSKFTSTHEKAFTKELKTFLQKKSNYINFDLD